MKEQQGELIMTPNPTLAQAKESRDAAMAQVEEHAGEDWNEYVYALIVNVARFKGKFTSDDVMEQMKWKPHDCRALGPAIKRVQKDGIIEPTDEFKLSTRRHATPIRVWKLKGQP